jgi:DNA modification methylase
MSDVIDSIICDDVLRGMSKIPDNSVSLVLTSPPYNVNIEYDNWVDNMPHQEYVSWLKSVWAECYRVLRPGGRLVINHDATVNHQDDSSYVRPMYSELCVMNQEIGFKFFTDIAWYKHQVVGRATAWGSYDSCSTPVVRRNHEYVIVWSKDSFTLPGDSEQSDMTPDEFEQWTMSFWHIQPETRNLGDHPVPFPEELARRVIKLFSYRNDVILDPFCGSGTTPFVAKMLNRRYIGIDNSKKYVKFARDRIESASDIFTEEYVPRSRRIADRKKERSLEVQEIEPDILGGH